MKSSGSSFLRRECQLKDRLVEVHAVSGLSGSSDNRDEADGEDILLSFIEACRDSFSDGWGQIDIQYRRRTDGSASERQ